MSLLDWFALLYVLPMLLCAAYVVLLGLRKARFPWPALALAAVPLLNLFASLILAAALVVILFVGAAVFVQEGMKS